MASSPPTHPATSPPPSYPTLNLPKKRPSIQVPASNPPNKRRKPSTASTSSAHPLRQTSFPPPDRDRDRAYSPDTLASQPLYSPTSQRSESLDVDDELTSVTSGRTTGKGGRKRGGGGGGGAAGTGTKRGVGRPPKNANLHRDGTASLLDGDTGHDRASSVGTSKRGANGAPSTHAGGDENAATGDGDAEDEEEDADVGDLSIEGGKLSKQFLEEDKERRALVLQVLHATNDAHEEQYSVWNASKLGRNTVRRLTNQTLSQSVPASVVNAIGQYTKFFAGEIVERAREVQKEWTAANLRLPVGEENVEGSGDKGEGEARVRERDRGPLTPDHLREALRRYKASRDGGVVGFTGLSMEGRERAAARAGGRRLFR